VVTAVPIVYPAGNTIAIVLRTARLRAAMNIMTTKSIPTTRFALSVIDFIASSVFKKEIAMELSCRPAMFAKPSPVSLVGFSKSVKLIVVPTLVTNVLILVILRTGKGLFELRQLLRLGRLLR
jgi:hypothetical protein